MVFLQRSNPNPRKRPAPIPDPHPSSNPNPNATPAMTAKVKSKSSGPDEDVHIGTMLSVLADTGCTLHVPPDAPPSLPSDPHRLQCRLESRLSSDPSLLADFLSGFSSYIKTPENLKRVLIPASVDGCGGSHRSESLVRLLLLVPSVQPQLQRMLLEKIPEYFDLPGASLTDDVARLIVNQFRWLDFLVDSEGFSEKLMEVLSISPLHLKKEIIGSLPEIVGDQSHGVVVAALERMLLEDSDVIMPVLDSFANLNLDDQLQEQAVTIALSCIRTVDAEHMPHLLRFLLLSATATNVRRIIAQIREQLKFVGASDHRFSRNKKLKGKCLADTTEASILDALRSSLRFKNILCEAILKELKCLDKPRDHKVIDVWFLMLIYKNGGSMQKAAEKILKRKIIDGCFCEALFDQCIHGQYELVRDYFPSFLSVCECLLSCKEKQARDFGIYLYRSLFEEFSDTYSRQELLGALVTHIGSGIGHEVSSALETMTLLTSKYADQLLPISFCINGILDYLEGFHEENLHKVYEVFCNLALCARSGGDSTSSSVANELLMIIRKQVSNSDMKYRKMGIIGTIKIVSTLGDINASTRFLSSKKTNCEEALELLKLSLDSCKSVTLPLILLQDELIALLESRNVQPTIIEWIGKHVGEFEALFLSDLDGGKLPMKEPSTDIEGELWMNLDGDISPICLNILPLLLSSSQQSSLQTLPSQFLLLSVIERLTNQGSLGGIDALLGSPFHLPSPKVLVGSHWKKLTGKQKQIVCISLYYAINWMRELLNAFITQVIGRADGIAQTTRNETMTKLFKRLRNLVFMESLLNASLKVYPLSLPQLRYFVEHSGSPLVSNTNHSIEREKQSSERMSQVISQTNRKCTNNTGALEKSKRDGKLRQPTLLDTFKRAGVVVSQEGSTDGSPSHLSDGKTSQAIDNQDFESNEAEVVDISAECVYLYAQRSKFRPLRVDCLMMLSFSENHKSCCSDPAAELPLHLYLLRVFHNKLDDFNPLSRQFVVASAKASPGHCKLTTCEFFKKIGPIFPSLKKHLDDAVSVLRDGPSCEDHWKSESSCAGNPDISYLVVSETSAAKSIFKEVLCCYCKMLSLPDLFLQRNLPILRDMLEAFQPNEDLGNFFSGFQPMPTAGHLDYLYCGVYSVLEGVLETAYRFSFVLASDVLVTLQSLVHSITSLIEKSEEANGKNMHVGYFKEVLPFLRSRLGSSAHKLLGHNWDGENIEGWKNKGDTVQKILQIYLKNSESTSHLLDELACSILPQVPSCKTKDTQVAAHGFPTLCPTMFLTWCRVLHEENLDILNKLVKEVILKCRANSQTETVNDVLTKLRQSVNIVVSLVNMCKVHDKVAVHAMAVRYVGKFVDIFLKAFDFLKINFQSHKEDIIQLVKELQKATRIIQALCSEAKGSKRTMVTSKIPATKRSMERFLFHVKALLYDTSSNGCTFWMGNLRHKDLYGQVVSSQVYANEEEEEAAAHVEQVDLEESEDDDGQGDDGN